MRSSTGEGNECRKIQERRWTNEGSAVQVWMESRKTQEGKRANNNTSTRKTDNTLWNKTEMTRDDSRQLCCFCWASTGLILEGEKEGNGGEFGSKRDIWWQIFVVLHLRRENSLSKSHSTHDVQPNNNRPKPEECFLNSLCGCSAVKQHADRD